MNFIDKLNNNINRNINYMINFNPEYRKASFGDVIGVNRGLYSHFGIYINDNLIIHYAAQNSDIGGTAYIHKTTLKRFLNRSNRYFVATFPFAYYFIDKNTIINKCRDCSYNNDWSDIGSLINRNSLFRVYSPIDTVKRAISRLGEHNYDLISNNCEHFAIWCKTGVSMSTQVRAILG